MSVTEKEEKCDQLAREVLKLSRNTLLVHLRFLDMAMSRLRPAATDLAELIGDGQGLVTDGQFLAYDPGFVLRRYRQAKELPVRDYLHVVLHCVFRHMYIHSLLDQPCWDLACDVAVEHTISGLGLRAAAAPREAAQQAELQKLEKELKLLSFTSRHAAAGLKRNISIADRIKPKNEHIYYFIDAINEAINTKRKISFLYFAYTPAKKKELKNGGEPYVLSPYTLTWNGDCYYVVGWSDKHGKVATFRVDRILETPEILPDAAVPRPKDYSIADFAEKAFQLFDADRTEVTLLCDAVAMNSVLDHFGDRAKTTPVDAQTFRLTTEVSLSPTFFAWVFQFGGKVRILGPDEAIEKYRTMLQTDKS